MKTWSQSMFPIMSLISSCIHRLWLFLFRSGGAFAAFNEPTQADLDFIDDREVLSVHWSDSEVDNDGEVNAGDGHADEIKDDGESVDSEAEPVHVPKRGQKVSPLSFLS